MSLREEELAMVVVAATFEMLAPGSPATGPLVLNAEQQSLPLEDVYHGQPGTSSLKWEGQGAGALRPGADIYVSGHAWAPHGQRAEQVRVGVHVGANERSALVFGERWWKRGTKGWVPSAPEPFESIPLLYERSFGGTVEGAPSEVIRVAQCNPIGRGLHPDPEQHPLPNIEDPKQLLTSPSNLPEPHGLGPIARGWLPRCALAGSFTKAWIEERAPFWPADTDPRFFHAAPSGLQVAGYLQGGTPVRLEGMHPGGNLHFELPPLRLAAKFYFFGGAKRVPLVFDALLLEPDALRVTLIGRASVVVQPSMLELERVIVRELESWETLP